MFLPLALFWRKTMKPTIITTKFEDGGVRFVLCHNKKGIWVSEVLPIFGGKYDGGWIFSEHAPNIQHKGDGYFYEKRNMAIKTARSVIRHKRREILNR